MAEDLKIVITANTAAIETATTELKKLETGFNTLSNTLKKEERSWTEYSSVVTAVATSFKAVHLAITSYIIAPLSGAVNGFVALGDQISKTSQRIGIGVESLGGLKFAAEQCGANFQILTEGIKAFQNQLGAAQMGDEGAIGKLGKIGLNAEDFAGLNNEKQLMKLADHIKNIGDKSEQTRVAMELFGKAGFKLLPFFQEGSEGIQKLMEEGGKIGAVLGEDAVNGAVNLCDAMNRLKTSASNISNVFIASLAPSISSILDGLTSFAQWTSQMVANYGPIIAGTGAFITSFSLLHGTIVGTTAALPALCKGLEILKKAISNPYILGISVAIGGLVAVWQLWNKSIRETEQSLKEQNEQAIKNEQEVKAINAADQKLFDRLQELANMEDPLNNNEIKEAKMLVDELNKKYKGLGLTIDENTGKIHGLANAQAVLMKEQAHKEQEALGQRYAALANQRSSLNSKLIDLEDKIRKQQAQIERSHNATAKPIFRKRLAKLKDEYNTTYQEFKKVRDEQDSIRERQAALRGVTTPEQAKPQEKSREQLTRDNTAEETARAKEKAEREEDYQKRDVQLQKDLQEARDVGKDPYTLRMEKVDRDIAEKLENLEKMKNIALQQGDMGRFLNLLINESEISAQGDFEKKKIQAEKAAEEQKTREAQAKEQASRAEELSRLTPELKTDRLTNAETSFQRARDKQAQAILANGDVTQADEEVKSAQQELAQAIAEASGLARKKAAENLKKAQEEYDNGKKQNFDQETMLKLAKALHDAKDAYDNENEKYFNAVGQLRQENEADIADAIQTTFSTSGTFSAYGMDAAVASDIPQQTLDVLRALLDNTDDIKEEQKNNGVFTA